MPIPDALPTLSAGAHDAGSGEACVMEYVSLLAGEDWSDRPECTHPLLAHEARTANDLLGDADRARLVPLVGRLFGTTDRSSELAARLRLTQSRQVLRLVEPSERGAVEAVLRRAEDVLSGTSDGEAAEAWELAAQHGVRDGDLDPEHAGHHVGASRIAAFVASPDIGAAEAWAVAALAVAHRVAAAECRADCGDPCARARRMVKDLGELVDVYDEVTGRTVGSVTEADVRALVTTLA